MEVSLASTAASPAYFSGLLIKTSPSASRFTFILSKKTYGKIKFSPHPDRIVVELTNTYKHFDIQNTTLRGANVKGIEIEETKEGLLRFIFHVNSHVKWDIHFLASNEDNGVHLQLDIVDVKTKIVHPSPSKSKTQHSPKMQADKKSKEKIQTDIFNTLSTLSAAKGHVPPLTQHAQAPRTFTIVIDAGHGGKDSGAIGRRGIKEKAVVLNIAHYLAKEINQQPHMRAVLTRTGDYFVPLRDRLKFARKGKADIFIAIHADAYFNHFAHGVSVYALSERGATSEAARWLAYKENYSELGSVALNALPDRDPILRSVLVDLAQTATIRDSIRLGNKVLDVLDAISPLHHRQVERAPFVVLKSPDIPSILVETGFISHPQEEQRLNDPRYQRKIAHTLWQGIRLYLAKR